MHHRRRPQADGVGLSVSALDLLFCTMGALMLIFAMQEKADIASARDSARKNLPAMIEQTSARIDQSLRMQPAMMAGVQAFPRLSGAAIFLIDLSGSFSASAQRKAQAQLVFNMVVQQGLSDFAVMAFAHDRKLVIPFGHQKLDLTSAERNAATSLRDGFEQAGMDLARLSVEMVQKLAVAKARVLAAEVGRGTNIIGAIDAANSELDEAAKAGALPDGATLVLLSDGEDNGLGAGSSPDQRCRRSPGPNERGRMTITLASSGMKSAADLMRSAAGLTCMQMLAVRPGVHMLMYNWSPVAGEPGIADPPTSEDKQADWLLRGGNPGTTP